MSRHMRWETEAEVLASGTTLELHNALKQRITAAAEEAGGFIDEATLKSWGINLSTDKRILWLPDLGAPAFQFEDRKVRPVVAEINLMIGAYSDFGGVSDWWLLPNVWLSQAPVALISKDRDKLLLEAARVIVDG